MAPRRIERIDWGRLARIYDWQLPLERAALRTLVELLGVGEGERLLDVGTGTAGLLRELALLPDPPQRALGLDSSAKMLARAGELPPGWELVTGEAESMPFGDRSFDVVTASYLLHTLDRELRARILAELRRVLRPGGRLGLVSVAPPRGRLVTRISWPIRVAAEHAGGALAGLWPLDPRPELVASGFEITACRRVGLRQRPGLGYPSLCVVARLRPR